METIEWIEKLIQEAGEDVLLKIDTLLKKHNESYAAIARYVKRKRILRDLAKETKEKNLHKKHKCSRTTMWRRRNGM